MHVLVVDDSAVVRQTVTELLVPEPDITVSVAADPIIAMQKMAVQRPDVILLDLQMPRMDGLTFLDKIMAEDPIPVVICSALSEPQSESAFRALAHGAVDVVGKPKIGLRAAGSPPRSATSSLGRRRTRRSTGCRTPATPRSAWSCRRRPGSATSGCTSSRPVTG